MANYNVGIGSVGSYQVSGKPWITGSGANGLLAGEEHRHIFPAVTRTVTVINTDAGTTTTNDIRVHFNATGSGDVIDGEHYIPLTVLNQSIELNIKCKEIFISMPAAANVSGSYVVIASLTGISPTEMYTLTGSGLTDS